MTRLKKTKSKRQIIVVTHNANIPVNGDAEYIISMDSDTDLIKTKYQGTMDDGNIRKEICDVMEEHRLRLISLGATITIAAQTW